MSNRHIKESDWKQFKKIHPIARERYFHKAMAKIHYLATEPDKTNTEKFWDINEAQLELAKEGRRLFDDMRRSTASLQLFAIYAEGLITDEELNAFSPEEADSTRETLSMFRKHSALREKKSQTLDNDSSFNA